MSEKYQEHLNIKPHTVDNIFVYLEGKFKDVIYKYNRFGLIEPEQGEEELKYRFEYDILEIPEKIREKRENCRKIS